MLRSLLGQEKVEKVSPAPRETAEAPEPPQPSEDSKESEDGPDPDLLDKAIEKATVMIREQKRGAEVKQALESVGVSKVTHLTDDETIRAFLDALPQ